MKSPPRIGVPLKFAVMLDDPGGLCASASVLRPDAASSPRPVDIPDVARKALRVTGRMTASASHQHQTVCRAHAAGVVRPDRIGNKTVLQMCMPIHAFRDLPRKATIARHHLKSGTTSMTSCERGTYTTMDPS